MFSFWKFNVWETLQNGVCHGELKLTFPLLDSQKRLEQQKPAVIVASTTSPTNSTSSTVSPAQKVMVAPLSGSVTPGTKMVLATKVGSPATVTFQQNKNFHQTFATWVKQGQSNSGRAGMNGTLLLFWVGKSISNLHFLRAWFCLCHCLRRQARPDSRLWELLFVQLLSAVLTFSIHIASALGAGGVFLLNTE